VCRMARPRAVVVACFPEVVDTRIQLRDFVVQLRSARISKTGVRRWCDAGYRIEKYQVMGEGGMRSIREIGHGAEQLAYL
jgi:hypothetical protein